MKVKSLVIVLKLVVLSTVLMIFNTGCEKETNNEKFTEEGIKYEKFFDLAKGDTIPKGIFRDKPYVRPEDHVTVLFSSEEYSSKATGNSTGSGLIADLMCSVRVENTAPDVWPGTNYIKIPVDLNEGAGGKYIYLYYSKITSAAGSRWKESAYCYIGVRENCCFAPIFVSLPGYMNKLGIKFGDNSAWCDLNDGAGGHYIKLEGMTCLQLTNYLVGGAVLGYPIGWTPDDPRPIQDILIISSTNSLSSYPGWTLIPTDLNMGAGGKWIYLCYKKEALARK